MNYLEVCYLVSKDVNISCHQFLGWFYCGWRRYCVDFRSFEFVEVCVMDYMVFLDIYSTNFWKECVFCWVHVLSYDQLSATPWTVAHQAPLSMEFSRQEYQGGLLFSHSVMSSSLWPHGLQHARLPCPSLSSGVCSNSCPLTRWCHPTISHSVVPFSSCLQSFSESGSFPMSWLFESVAKVLELQHQSFQWIFRVDFL